MKDCLPLTQQCTTSHCMSHTGEQMGSAPTHTIQSVLVPNTLKPIHNTKRLQETSTIQTTMQSSLLQWDLSAKTALAEIN